MMKIKETNDYIEMKFAPGAWFPMGNEGTTWRVLDIDKEEHKALVVAQESVAEKKYHHTDEDITWEKCSLREWLNGQYYKNTFSEYEKAAILETRVVNQDNAEYGITGGNDTDDRIFLLSLEESQEYINDKEERSVNCWWWLRSPDCYSDFAVLAYPWGKVNNRGGFVNHSYGVRPAFYIDLHSEFFGSLISEDKFLRFSKFFFSNEILSWISAKAESTAKAETLARGLLSTKDKALITRIESAVTKENADGILSYMTERISEMKKSPKKTLELRLHLLPNTQSSSQNRY